MKSVKSPIRFKFDLDKFIACVAFFAKENLTKLDKLKVCKLLYFADKQHLLNYGRPIIGDVYYHLDYGPIPSKSLDILNDVSCNRISGFSGSLPNRDRFTEFLKIKKEFRHPHPVFNLVKEPNLDCLSISEQEALREIIKKYGQLSPGELIDETHKDSSWLKSQNTEEIDYRLFFDNELTAKQEALEYLESLREDSEFLFGLVSSDRSS